MACNDRLVAFIFPFILIKETVILFNLLKCLTSFYCVNYVISGISFGAFGLQKFDGTMPFDFKNFIDLSNCCMSFQAKQLANLVTMLVSYFLSAWCFLFFVQHRMWDYAVTVTLIHVAFCCLVMLSFPLNWSWWICLGLGLVIMISVGEIVSYFIRQKTDGKASSEAEKT